ncbi:aryl hydrocarbon receptor-like [Echeneis naucrates]|uniref:aryl hydrocarbon receptor-like n=1 Tax=Echeneis naucrates TaxID=173247 RepID=UPI001113CC51|nr:aryl hydrocarbon receptor-like [Echeneis naucrates]
MLGNPGTYANKKRKKPVLKQKKISDGNEGIKSNPSKRHRDRLNGELDRLTDLLPFSEDVRSRLDKLSVLRLSVGYLRVKSYFKATLNNNNNISSSSSSSSLTLPRLNGHNGNNVDIAGFSEGDLLLQALNGFVMVVTSDGSVFYASPTVKDYLGFHQSDVVHQSVFELIHTDDRAMFRQQLHFALNPPAACDEVMYSPEQLPPENSSFLERSFTCRFRCLLDNSSGFLNLKFHGRLKYLHGQSVLRDNRMSNKPQLALFTIAVPVQPPSIVEIRAKMLLFQTKHKLDFTPLSIDSRGKLVLGYSETELCMKGSGYQFIHAADMMHCADNHFRMIKTGETGMTVFRLLSKSGGWVWVKANAKVIYKGGQPDFIISHQKVLVNMEGEDHLRQRRLQLPFNFATGEAVLYDTGPTIDVTQFQFNKMFSDKEGNQDVAPGSLLDSFLKQDENIYTNTQDPTFSVDQVFMESRALVSIPSNTWQENGPTTGEPMLVKEETKHSVMAMINSLGKRAQNGDLSATLQSMEVDNGERIEWKNPLKRLSQEEDHQNTVRSELDSILTNDIIDYIESVLFKKGEGCLDESPPSCFTAGNNSQPDPFTQTARFSATQLCEPPLFPTPSPDQPYSPMDELCAAQQDPGQIFTSTQKLSHQGLLIPQAETNLPPLQQLQLQDIFSPSIELPELTLPDASADDPLPPFPSCAQVPMSHVGCPQVIPGQTQSTQRLLCPQNSLQAPAMATNGPLLQSSVKQPNHVAPGMMDILPLLIACNDISSSTTGNIPIPFTTACLQGSPPVETHNHQVRQWQQSQQQKLPHAGIMQNGHEPTPACHSQTSESQTFPHTGLWPRCVTRLNHTQPGGLACGQAATHGMFDQHFSSNRGPTEGDMLALSGSSAMREANAPLDHSPMQRCFQWSRCDPVVGTSTVSHENANVMFPSEHALNIQHYLQNGPTQQD